MKSEELGARTSQVEVANISKQGFWLFLGGRELFVSFKDFPWFESAPVSKILNVEWPQADHLYWPDLDVDLSAGLVPEPALAYFLGCQGLPDLLRRRLDLDLTCCTHQQLLCQPTGCYCP